MNGWFNYTAVLQIICAGVIIGAGLPALFSPCVRLNAEGVGVADRGGTVSGKNPALVALGWILFAVVLVAVIVGVLFIARDFIGQHTGMYILGAKSK